MQVETLPKGTTRIEPLIITDKDYTMTEGDIDTPDWERIREIARKTLQELEGPRAISYLNEYAQKRGISPPHFVEYPHAGRFVATLEYVGNTHTSKPMMSKKLAKQDVASYVASLVAREDSEVGSSIYVSLLQSVANGRMIRL